MVWYNETENVHQLYNVGVTAESLQGLVWTCVVWTFLAGGIVWVACSVPRASGVGGVAAAHALCDVLPGLPGWGGGRGSHQAHLVRAVCGPAVLSDSPGTGNLLIKVLSYAGLGWLPGKDIGKYYFLFLENTWGSGPTKWKQSSIRLKRGEQV